MASKIRILVGDIEVEFEGSEEFMAERLPEFIELVGTVTPFVVRGNGVSRDPKGTGAKAQVEKDPISMTTNNIASKLGVKTGPELVQAACAFLSLVKGSERFARAEILHEMREAAHYYKDTYGKNLSGSLQSLVRQGKLLEPAKNRYALNAATKKELEAQLRA